MGSYTVREQFGRGLRVGSVILLATVGILVVAYLVTRVAGISFTDLSRDPAATLDGPWYTGLLSTSAIVTLLAGAGIALFAASLLPSSDVPSRRGLLVALGLLIVVIAADDLFMLHEAVFPVVGVGSVTTFAIYGLALIVILWRWRTVIAGATDWVFLLLAAVGMGISVGVDVVLEERLLTLPFSGELIEDPAKIVGMVFMSYYLITTARQALLEVLPNTTD